jgi:hypothetical protein
MTAPARVLTAGQSLAIVRLSSSEMAGARWSASVFTSDRVSQPVLAGACRLGGTRRANSAVKWRRTGAS